jgi:long-subunit acyl-CoA synthetase (AMP-forming)
VSKAANALTGIVSRRLSMCSWFGEPASTSVGPTVATCGGTTPSSRPHPSTPPNPSTPSTAVLLYTSGTTGKPKGIMHTTGGYLTQLSYTHFKVVVHKVR